ncbi:hypothetical protein QN362_17140 [Actimicrobium sp. CCC2.4]|uniref:hypothetical protein n=1 Tax=Actimicrobium sp. CCC2.4 TaxID=3048606 RepID=UPI002AC8DFF8|nr:hypothetical protein [Actimicrobium sp. CCC2.4]MEB0137063.1 hypothetical protein [Actimicrobium sp. CCC2.4]WPX33648.1 hypothetical protein RHM62_07430 [Actimicrobium sp. CCC2.4]
MNKLSLVILMTFAGLAGTANAQLSAGITESTDPAKIAAIEQRAQALGYAQSAPSGSNMLDGTKTMRKMEYGNKPHGEMHGDKMHHGKKHHGKKHHRMMRGDKAAAAEMPAATAK